jgi:hypothetical protein
MLRPLLSTWYACAQRLGDVELSVRLLVEMLGHGWCYYVLSVFANLTSRIDMLDEDEPETIQDDLLTLLKVVLFLPFPSEMLIPV